MLLTQTVTVWNLLTKSAMAANTYQRTVLKTVRYDISDKGLVLYVVPIFAGAAGRVYVPRHEFDTLADKTMAYTFGPEDFIGLGEIADAAPSPGGAGHRKDWRVDRVLERMGEAGGFVRVNAK